MADEKWTSAKEVGRDKLRASDWAFILDVYTRIGGDKQIVHLRTETGYIRLLGTFTDTTALVLDDGQLSLMDSGDVSRMIKAFSTTTPDMKPHTYSLTGVMSQVAKEEISSIAFKGKTDITVIE